MVGAILVLFNPDIDKLKKGLESLLPQVDKVFIIDNSVEKNHYDCIKGYDRIEYHSLGRNLGIAAAQNIGIRMLREQGFSYALFSDQDSCAAPGLIKSELEAHKMLSKKFKVAAVGPMPVHKESGRRYFNGHIIDKGIICNMEYHNVNYIISSFSLISLKAFEKVGLYNEGLFIDAVETSWCFRASYYFGMQSFILPTVSIEHELGKSSSFLGIPISISTPFRLYYQLRNLFWESKEEYAPYFWKKRNLGNVVPKIIYFPLFCKGRFKYISSIVRGLRDGLFRKYSVGIPQYSGSACPDFNATFNEWIQWYQTQPLTENMKKIAVKDFEISDCLSLEQPEAIKFFNNRDCEFSLLCFNGEIKAVASHDRATNKTEICSPNGIITPDFASKIGSMFECVTFVAVDIAVEDKKIKSKGVTFYPWNGFALIMPKVMNEKLGEEFSKAQTVIYEKCQ